MPTETSKNHAATDFGTTGEIYASYRPQYPPKLAEKIISFVAPPYKFAVDLGAGTGISTYFLSRQFQQVAAVEADQRMIDAGNFEKNATVICAHAEKVALKHNSCQLVCCGNAFYWMDGNTVVKLAHRWLQKDGVFAVYRYDIPQVLNTEINAIIQKEFNERWSLYQSEALRSTGYSYNTISGANLFSSVVKTRVEHIIPLSANELLGFFASTSYGSKYLQSIPNPEIYLQNLQQRICSLSSTSFEVDFGLELIVATK